MKKMTKKLMIAGVVCAALAGTTFARPHGGPGMGPRPGGPGFCRPGPGFRPAPGPGFRHGPGPGFRHGPGPGFRHGPGPGFRPGPVMHRPGPHFGMHPGPRPFHRPPPMHWAGWRRGCHIHPHYRSIWVGDIWYDAYGYPCYSPSYLAVTPVANTVVYQPGVTVVAPAPVVATPGVYW